jgi:hypothetical protein
MGHDTSLQQFLEMLNDLKHYHLYFPEEHPKHLHQDEIIEILDQDKTWDLDWYEAMGILTLILLKCLIKNLFLASSI